MLKNGIARILISVNNLNNSVKFFQDNIGMSVVADYPLNSATINQLWKLPPETTAHVVTLKNDEQTTLLELIEWQPNSGRSIRNPGNTTDYGLFTIAFRAKDVDTAYKNFKQQGYQFICPPITYTFSLGPVTVKEAIMVDFNGIPIVFLERLSEPIPKLKGNFGMMLDTSQIVTDIDEAKKFYVDILGLTTIFDQKLPPGMIDNILNFPQGTESRMAFLNQPGSKTPLLELIQSSIEGKSLLDLAQPPNLGLFAIAFASDNLELLIDKLQQHKIKILCEPVIINISEQEQVKAIVVEGPNGVNLQFFEH